MRPKLSPKKRARNLEGSGLNPPFEKVEETNDSINDEKESSTLGCNFSACEIAAQWCKFDLLLTF
ncbi:MAG: hypothetical protein EBS16_11395 [Betaproteobacteria bacterium]|nr:hypothetical protein [Betaproteobacteria bacterium]